MSHHNSSDCCNANCSITSVLDTLVTTANTFSNLVNQTAQTRQAFLLQSASLETQKVVKPKVIIMSPHLDQPVSSVDECEGSSRLREQWILAQGQGFLVGVCLAGLELLP